MRREPRLRGQIGGRPVFRSSPSPQPADELASSCWRSAADLLQLVCAAALALFAAGVCGPRDYFLFLQGFRPWRHLQKTYRFELWLACCVGAQTHARIAAFAGVWSLLRLRRP